MINFEIFILQTYRLDIKSHTCSTCGKKFTLNVQQAQTYFVFFSEEASTFADFYLFEGIEVKALFEYMSSHTIDHFPAILRVLSKAVGRDIMQLINGNALIPLSKNYPYPGYFYEYVQDPILVHGNDHLIQLSVHVSTWSSHPTWELSNAKIYEHIIIFDDYWAAANSSLANSILNCASGWNVFGENLHRY